ncbi:MAG TPA: hypothetical protein VJN95_02150 [Gemmatimonadales bacterium]|nr:hypothetical protein [Gemmatimonadales bacterium]
MTSPARSIRQLPTRGNSAMTVRVGAWFALAAVSLAAPRLVRAQQPDTSAAAGSRSW